MITIIFGLPRSGKTCLMTHLLNEICFDLERYAKMCAEIANLNNNGFDLSFPKHCCFSNYNILYRKFGYTRRKGYFINPFCLGYSNKNVETLFLPSYSAIGISEAQKYLNSRMSKNFPDWQSRWYEQHGHNNLDIFLDVQRPNLIDINIRELSNFIEIISLDKKKDIYGNVRKLIWSIRRFGSSAELDQYFASGKTKFFTADKIVANYNVFKLYDSQNCKPKFYDGHFDNDFNFKPFLSVEQNKDSYMEYLKKNDDEQPDRFYLK